MYSSLVFCNSDSRNNSATGHPVWRRCSSLEYCLYAPSSRLARPGAAPQTYATNYCDRTLVGTERHPQQLEQPPPLLIGPGRRDDRHIHPAGRVDLHVIDFDEHQLVGQS